MRHVIRFLILVPFFLLACQSNIDDRSTRLVNNPKSATESDRKEVAQIAFTNIEHDFGRLIQGEKVVHIFKFKNSGNVDLIVSQVSASCGCTASKFTKEPLKPGEEGKIEVTFDSNGQRGIQNKTITVISNGLPQTTVLRLKAQVTTPESY
ncbi:MAG: hypothetical protein FD155_1620 [Bacteroidetes bacterium]|nr:MAG: hypothetical protein FD155_1620 [Bacteroidota bacterium]